MEGLRVINSPADVYVYYNKLCHVLPEKFVNYIEASDYKTAPASAKFHNNVEGGLLGHSVNVTAILLKLTTKFNIKWERKVSPLIIGMLHDLCKVNFYSSVKKWRKDDKGSWESYKAFEVKDQDPLGHGDKSVILALANGADLTMQEIYCIMYHMGSFGDSDYQMKYSEACKKHPEITLVALADQLAGIYESGVDSVLELIGF